MGDGRKKSIPAKRNSYDTFRLLRVGHDVHGQIIFKLTLPSDWSSKKGLFYVYSGLSLFRLVFEPRRLLSTLQSTFHVPRTDTS